MSGGLQGENPKLLQMSTTNSSDPAPVEDEVSLALVAILALGTVAMLALLSCYVCVFRQLCCQPPPDAKRRRLDSNCAQEELQMGETTQNVEISVGTVAPEPETPKTGS